MTSTTYITLICLAFVGAATAGSDWSYKDMSKWKDSNMNCVKNSQSPINIETSKAELKELGDFNFSKYTKLSNAKLLNNGHTVQLEVKGLTLSGGNLTGTYDTLQLHFHWSANVTTKGSEHTVDKKSYPLEMHIVHVNPKYHNASVALTKPDGLAVLGFFFKIGDENPQLKTIIPYVGNVTSSGKNIKSFDLKGLISEATKSDKYFRYSGSLTTPPCSEAVIWTVYEMPLKISEKQLNVFWSAEDGHGKRITNYRPVQSLNGRKVFKNSPGSGSGMTKAFSVLVVFSVVLSYLS
ncbi:carbonic anhydrase 15-like [Octopus vulgaris]|uniref:Carbonic anhydrase n=3 Tax=Octopus vulgaris TaxID=6645 RepID=A0AA36AGD9_OCTVU|nr:carbonic anhydrase 15-like [Octopus vulgaris]